MDIDAYICTATITVMMTIKTKVVVYIDDDEDDINFVTDIFTKIRQVTMFIYSHFFI